MNPVDDVVVLLFSSGTTGCQGGHAHPPQSRREHLPVRPCNRSNLMARWSCLPSVLPHLRYADLNEWIACKRRHRGHLPRFDLDQSFACARTPHHPIRSASGRTCVGKHPAVDSYDLSSLCRCYLVLLLSALKSQWRLRSALGVRSCRVTA